MEGMLRSLPQRTNGVQVALVFPPLVETNFGHYYPSTAVLAGYLSASGTGSIQTDLNEDFASYLLRPESLEAMADGRFGDGLVLLPNEMPAVAARLLLRHAGSLVDEQGRHLFRDESSDLAYLLKILVQPYRIDERLSVMASPGFYARPGVAVYTAFFERTGYAASLPLSMSLVGISVAVGPQLAPALVLARYLKTHRPGLAVVLGGSAISLMPETDIEMVLSSNPAVDALVRFDGEYPLESLAEQKRAGIWTPTKVPGVSCRVGTAITHSLPEAGPRLDSLPYAEYDTGLLLRLAKPEIGIVQSRGCYWGKCAYCDYVELYRGSRPFRTRTPDNFANEMEYQSRKHGVNQFSLITEAIAPAFAARLSELIVQRGLSVKWHSFAMIDRRFTRGLFEAMVRSGCEFLIIGAETMTDRVLRFMHKAATKEETVSFLREAKASGPDIKVNLIPNLPSTTSREALDSLAAFRELQESFNFVSVFPFEATRSSRVGREPERFGLCGADSERATGQAQFTANHLIVYDPAMTADEREKVFTRYREFAAQVNNRETMDTLSNVVRDDDMDRYRLRLADDILDLTRLKGEVQCFNWLTRERFMMPEECWVLIEKMRSKQPFRRADFIGWTPSTTTGEFYFHKMLEKGMLAIVESPNGK